eukprot:CAMPEP_0202383552 /NCGR_PEP_ID=MMETSP1127-20130417/49841_1 /ASSEMBLY_ACC=CAM_ASM_000462 /TAXON_ID=3047 /ORGANISM="Dunaliella tertiolecta, Strain CCMP1320" /LENGTH=49 /DNA_ID= /DNA_START= /DNA_END= /DNA_ORIENTATION=
MKSKRVNEGLILNCQELFSDAKELELKHRTCPGGMIEQSKGPKIGLAAP